MVRPLITIVILGLTAAVGIRADAGGGGGLTVGQVKLSAPIPVTLDVGVLDVFDHIEFFTHPTQAIPWQNFQPELQEILLPNQSIAVDDLALFGNQWPGVCAEVMTTVKPYFRASQEETRSKNLKKIGKDPAMRTLIPQYCDQLLTEYDLLATEPTKITNNGSNWCEAHHQQFWKEKVNVSNALQQMCTLLLEAQQAFPAQTLPYNELCSTYADCNYPAAANVGNCGPFKLACYQYKGSNQVAPVTCLLDMRDDTATWCDGHLETVFAACVESGPLSEAQLSLCGKVLEFRAQITPCLDLGLSPESTQCGQWAYTFVDYCTTKELLDAQLEAFAASQIEDLCQQLAVATEPLKQLFPDAETFCNLPDGELCAGLNDAQCAQRKALCGVLTGNGLPLARMMVGDVRAKGNVPAVGSIQEVTFTAEPAAPYAAVPVAQSFPAALYTMPSGAVLGDTDWFAGMVAIMRDPRPSVEITGSGAGTPISELSEQVQKYNLYGWPAIAYYQYRSDEQPPLHLAATSSSFFGPLTSGAWEPMPGGVICDAMPKPGDPLFEPKFYKNLGCVPEKGPVGIAALTLFDDHMSTHARDLVVINQGPLSYEPEGDPPVSYVTIYRHRESPTLYPTKVEAFTDMWTYYGYRKLSGFKPMEHCVDKSDVYIAINKPGTNAQGKPAFFVDRVTSAQGTITVVPIEVTYPPVIAGIVEYGPYGLACGDYNNDEKTDLAVSWAILSEDGQLVDFEPSVWIYLNNGDDTFDASPKTKVDAIAIQEDGDPKASPAKAEFSSLTTCDLNRDTFDDLCVGDQRVYLVEGAKRVYMHYFPFTELGFQAAGMEQLHQLNTHAKYVPDNGLGGVQQITVDRYENVAAVIKAPRFYPPLVEIFCKDYDQDGIADMGGSILEDGKPTGYANIDDPEMKAAVDKACNQDNCPGIAPAGFVMPKACDGSEGSEAPQVIDKDGNLIPPNLCYNPSQKDWDQDGFGNVCDPIEIELPLKKKKQVPSEPVGPVGPPVPLEPMPPFEKRIPGL